MKKILTEFLLVLLFIIGCSSANPVITPKMEINSPILSSKNLLGVYELNISADSMNADLIPKRQLEIGQSWIISGRSYFDSVPCKDCFKISGLGYNDRLIQIKFSIRHPFQKGNTSEPPTAKNRLDLDIFDLVMIVAPKPLTTTNYSLTNIKIPSYVIDNPDGFTNELSDMLGSTIALPYVLVIDDSKNDPPSSTYNKFEMGTSKEFAVRFPITSGQVLTFDLYLTFGYGSSATFKDRLNPIYFNPEFNRKAAWKVEVIPPNGDNEPQWGNTWNNEDNTTLYDVTVKVYDWQIGANVNPDLINSTDIYAKSDVAKVTLEIPGMHSSIKELKTAASGTGSPTDPLIYIFSIANENLISGGKYTALIAVYDERSPLDFSKFRDYLIHSPDGGRTLENHEIPIYVTYQIFTAHVVSRSVEPPSGDLMWAKRAGGTDLYDYGESITALSDNSMVITGQFQNTANFGRGGPNETIIISYGLTDIFIARYNQNGELMWVKKAGGANYDSGYSVTTLSDNSIIVTGEFQDTAKFGEGEANETTLVSEGDRDIFLARYKSDGTLIWAKREGGSDWDTGLRVTALTDDSFVLSGYYRYQPITFGKGEPNETTLNCFGLWDVYIAKFNPNGTLQWAKWAGGISSELMWGITAHTDNSTVITGYFNETVIFGEGTPNQTQLISVGNSDIFIARYNSNGTLTWAKRAGGTSYDQGFTVTALSDTSTAAAGSFMETAIFGQGEPNQTQLTATADQDIWIARYNPNGTLAWAKKVSSTILGEAWGMTTLSNDSFVVTGQYWGSATFGEGEPNETILTPFGYSDFFLARYNPNGSLVWAKRAGGIDWDKGNWLDSLADDSIVATGRFKGTSKFGISEPNETILTSDGGEDIFIARFKP